MRIALPLLTISCVTPATVGERVDEPAVDLDADGFDEQSDCDDLAPLVNPGATESCDGIDNDCDAIVDGEVCARDAVFVQTMQLDVLFVVDNSASMLEEQVAVSDGVRDLLEWVVGDGYDTHIGAISMDMENRNDAGRLRSDSDGRTFTHAMLTLDEVETFISDVIVMGTEGHFDERGRDAVYAAAVELAGTENEGFRRHGAHLAVVFLSDEDDVSTLSVADFLPALATDAQDPSFHALVSAEFECGESPGFSYLDLVAASGGTTLSICEPDYGPFLAAVGQISAQRGLERRFALAERAQPGSVKVDVTLPSGLQILLEPEDHALGGAGDVLVLTGTPPPVGSRLEVTFDALGL